MGKSRKSLTNIKIGDMLVNMNTKDDYYGDVIIILDINDGPYPYHFRSMLDDAQDWCREVMFIHYEKVENVDELPYNSQFR
jgi:hypothetical protein